MGVNQRPLVKVERRDFLPGNDFRPRDDLGDELVALADVDDALVELEQLGGRLDGVGRLQAVDFPWS